MTESRQRKEPIGNALGKIGICDYLREIRKNVGKISVLKLPDLRNVNIRRFNLLILENVLLTLFEPELGQIGSVQEKGAMNQPRMPLPICKRERMPLEAVKGSSEACKIGKIPNRQTEPVKRSATVTLYGIADKGLFPILGIEVCRGKLTERNGGRYQSQPRITK